MLRLLVFCFVATSLADDAPTVEYYECLHPGDIPCRHDSDCCGSSVCNRVQVTDMIVGLCSDYSLQESYRRGLDHGNC